MRKAIFGGKKLSAVFGALLMAGAFTIGVAYAQGTNRAVPMDSPAFGQFLGSCNFDADCPQGDTCQSFRQNGLRCTHSCNVDSDCEAPSKGCSKQHRCSNATATAGHPRR